MIFDVRQKFSFSFGWFNGFKNRISKLPRKNASVLIIMQHILENIKSVLKEARPEMLIANLVNLGFLSHPIHRLRMANKGPDSRSQERVHGLWPCILCL